MLLQSGTEVWFNSAYTDELTGLYNRRAYEEGLDRIRKDVPSEKRLLLRYLM